MPCRLCYIDNINLNMNLSFYFRRYVLSSNNIVMHHYRECPKVPHWRNCLNEPRTKDFKMNEIKEEMVKRVKSVQKLLGFPSIDS
jgi:hypothetical protein